ncbi:2-hydroxyacid dehydrogenase [Cytobacillus gottheilii]|uniref:2-hydroxyacid dehydrogenase n=1 Tax=Cytobacillus gottheilii TaxID=859144 RepID=UPI0009BBC3BA|nr:D-glycerate dehydrogenase [Cytobacillus gottheilii]
MKSKVIVYRKTYEQVLDLLREQCDVIYFERIDSSNQEEFYFHLKDAHALFGAGMKVDKELLDHAPNLQVVSNVSVGYDNLNLAELKKRNIKATNTKGALDDTVADAMFGLMLTAARRITELDQFVKKGEWKAAIQEELFGVDVHHKTIGIIGMGGIGSAIAKRAYYGFDMKVIYHNRSRNKEAEEYYHAEYRSLEELLQESDFVCNMAPLTPQTEKLIGEREFSLMKSSSIFINGSRGPVIDEDALYKALSEKRILAAGLDVYQVEPLPPEHSLLTLPNLVTLPHIGSATAETRLAMGLLAAKSLLEALNGGVPATLIASQ